MKWILGIGAVAIAVGFLVWQVLAEPPRVGAPAVSNDPDTNAPPPQGDARGGSPSIAPASPTLPVEGPTTPDDDDDEAAAPRTLEPPPVERFEPGSERFQKHVDIDIPDRLRAAAARCYDGRGDGDRSIALRYRLRALGGAAEVGDVAVTESELGDAALERCIVDAVAQVRWSDPRLPDVSSDESMFLRLRTLKKYRGAADD